MEEKLQKIGDELIRRLDSSELGIFFPKQPTSGYETAVACTESESGGGVTYADIEATYNLLADRPPFMTKCWLVDVPHLYVAIKECLDETPDFPPGLIYTGTPLVSFDRRFMDNEKEVIALPPGIEGPLPDVDIVWPWFCAIPGVWCEMSDGKPKWLPPRVTSKWRFVDVE